MTTTVPTPPAVPAPRRETFLRVEKGNAEPEELAAVTAVLLARATAGPAAPSASSKDGSAVGWSRPERRLDFRPPHSWRD